ncbi:extracellular solute-binding protein [bacterium LRH843]|nr:extracellular solute-binding protein [bacterium LRH843]
MKIELNTMTWNHPRAINPMKATFEEFKKGHPEVSMNWATRSLKDFEDFPIEELSEKYDLILLDHPCIGRAVETNSLIPLNDLLSEKYLEELNENSVGPSFESYIWDSKVWALPVDTAAQVSAYRQDLLEKYNLAIPTNWEEISSIGKQLPDHIKIGFPLNSTHAFISFMTLCANISGNDFWDIDGGFKLEIAEEALLTIKQIVSFCHPVSLNADPIDILELMGKSDEIIYAPLIYGYINYSFNGFKKHIVHFSDIPSFKPEPIGSIIGGVGLGISSKCKHVDIALEYAMYVASGACQKGIYFENDGQPAHRDAWTDREVNKKANNFFKNTLKTLDSSYVRPRYNGYTLIQDPAGGYIRQFLLNELNVKETISFINGLIKHLNKSI